MTRPAAPPQSLPRVPIDRLIGFGAAFMARCGVPPDTARAVSRLVVETEAFRQSTHGLVQFKVIHQSLRQRTVDPAAEPATLRETGATAWFDGARCLGLVSALRAQSRAVALAHAHGIGYVGVRNTQWVGALGTLLADIARQGLLCQAWAQSSNCKDCAPFGGRDPRFSTNPIALAFPADGHPVLADFSTTTMSLGAAQAMIRQGARARAPRFLDADGNPSADPAVLKQGGTLMFLGGETDGHKGYALSLFNEALTVLAGGSANNPEAPFFQSFAIMALDPAAFAGAAYYAVEMRRFLDHVRGARSRSDAPVRLPGERGFAALADCLARGVPLDPDKRDLLRRIAKDEGLEPPA